MANMFKPQAAKNVREYIAQIDEPRKSEIKKLHDFIKKIDPSLKPFIIHNIIGYGKRPYETKSGLTGDWFILGLASQKNYISIYACESDDGAGYIAEKYKKELAPASVGKSCIRYKKFDDIDLKALGKVLKEAAKVAKKRKVAKL